MTRRDLLKAGADALLGLPYEAWHFGDSVAFEALLAASDALDESKYRDFAHGFARGWAAARPQFRPLDCTAAGAAMCRIAEDTGDRLLLSHLIRLGGYLIERATIDGVYRTWDRSPLRESYGTDPLTVEEEELLADPGPGVFVDCLHFDPPFFAALARATGDEEWLARAQAQALGYIRLLQDPLTGLFHHFVLERTSSAHILGWGRGQGWALLGLLDVLEQLPAGSARETLSESVRRLVDGMVATQRPDGHWNAVVQRADGGIETSTAAFMAVGFARAVREGVVDRPVVTDAADRALRATVSSTDAEGVLKGVSVAVWASTSISHYDHVPRDFVVPWGQGPAVLALVEADRTASGGVSA